MAKPRKPTPTPKAPPQSPLQPERPENHYAFPAFLAVVFLLKFIVVWQLRHHPLLQPNAGVDTTAYVNLARRVLAGNWLLGPGQYFVSPLYIYVLAGILGLTKAFTAVRLSQIALGTGAVALIFVTTEQWFGRRAAWVAGVAAALTGLFTFYETLIMQAALDPILTAAALASLTLALKRSSGRWYFLTGLIFGIQTLNRPNVAVAAAGILVILVAQRRVRPAALMIGGLALALAPVTIRNVIVTGEWTLPSSHGGLNFYIGNGEGATGGFHQVPGISPAIEGQEADAKRVAEGAVGHPLTDGQVSSYFTHKALSWMTQHPAATAVLWLRKIAFTLNAAHSSLDFSYSFYAYDTGSSLRVMAVQPWLLVPLGLVGLVWAAPRERRTDYLVFAAFAPLYVVAVAIFFVSERYRLPLLVPLCIGAGAAIDRAMTTFTAHDLTRVAIPGAAFVALGAVANWPFGLDDGRGQERVRMAGVEIGLGHYDEAERWASLAVAVHPTPSVAHFRIGTALLIAGQVPRALDHLTQANALDPHQPPVEFALGQALLGSNRPAEALPLLRRGIDGGVESADHLARLDLARALADTGDAAAAIDALRLVKPTPEDDVEVWLRMGRLAAELKEPAMAESFFRHAVDMRPELSSAHEQYGLALIVLNRFDEGAREFGAAVRLNPKAATSFAYLALCDAKLGRAEEARKHVDEALRLDPESPIARQVLALIRRN
jgi:tetratricopeptide (TPR) repeat protein